MNGQSGARLILHIGGQKCGSSAIQGYLFFGRFKLEEHNVIYLDHELGSDPKQARSHTELLPKLFNGGAAWVESRAALLDWSDPSRTYVISSEGFCQLPRSEQLAEAMAPIGKYGSVEILFYVRPQTELLYSGWQQWGLDLEFEEWIDDAIRRDFANWSSIWTNWRRHFPRADFHVRLFSRESFAGGDILQDLLETTKLPRIKPAVEKAANPTYSDLIVLAIRAVANEFGLSAKKLCVEMKKSGVTFEGPRENLVMSKDVQDRIFSYYAEVNERFLDSVDAAAQMRDKFRANRHLEKKAHASEDVLAKIPLVKDQIMSRANLRALCAD